MTFIPWIYLQSKGRQSKVSIAVISDMDFACRGSLRVISTFPCFHYACVSYVYKIPSELLRFRFGWSLILLGSVQISDNIWASEERIRVLYKARFSQPSTSNRTLPQPGKYLPDRTHHMWEGSRPTEFLYKYLWDHPCSIMLRSLGYLHSGDTLS